MQVINNNSKNLIMSNKLFNFLILFFLSLTGCNLKGQTIHYFKNMPSDSIIKPNVIKGNSVLQSVEINGKKDFYWIEYNGTDTINHLYPFSVYNYKGKFLGTYFYFLIDITKFKNKNHYFKVYFNNDYFENIPSDSFNMIIDKKGKQYFIYGNKSYLMIEYIPRDSNPNDKKRKKYYTWKIPENLPKHSVMIEDTENDFLYFWMVYIKSKSINNSQQRIYMKEYDYSGREVSKMSFVIDTVCNINLENYSFLRSLFFDKDIFINNGKYYPMKDIKLEE